MRLTEGSMINLDVVIHGSPYRYDRHVPIYFLGAGVSSRVSLEKVATTDVAPTLAELAGIKFSQNIDGRALIKRKN